MAAKSEKLSAPAPAPTLVGVFATTTMGCIMGCGSSFPEPRNELMGAEASYRAAQVAGAEVSPQSALYLKRCREQVEQAHSLIEDGDNERALWVLRRAQIDAELALALARETAERQKAIEAKEALDQLRDKLDRNRP